jgi:ferredoxin
MARLRIEVAKAKCRSFGKCMSVAPEVFAFDGEKKVSVVEGAAAPDETIAKAAKSCPYRVIALFDEDTGEQVFPPVRKAPPPSS